MLESVLLILLALVVFVAVAYVVVWFVGLLGLREPFGTLLILILIVALLLAIMGYWGIGPGPRWTPAP